MADLLRFRQAQAPVYDQALAELRAGAKKSHWMWFIFPQVAGLGSSAMNRRYAIADVAEARAYLADATLGPRLLECTAAMLANADSSAHAILGSPDDMKFRSSMTLFHRADPSEPAFSEALHDFFDGREDAKSLHLLGLK